MAAIDVNKKRVKIPAAAPFDWSVTPNALG
jgi:hypothetical protein